MGERKSGITNGLGEFFKVNAIRRMFSMLSLTPFEIVALVGLALLYAMLEGIGIGLLMPVLQFIEKGQQGVEAAAKDSQIWQLLLAVTDALHVPLTLLTLLVLSFIPVLLRQVAYFASTWYSALVQNRAITRLRTRGFRLLMHSDVDFIVSTGPGNIISYLTSQIGVGGQAIFQFLRLVILGILIFVYLAVLALVSWPLMIVAAFALAVVSGLLKGNLRQSREQGVRAAELTNEQYHSITERIQAIRLIKMLGQEDAESEFVARQVLALQDAQVRIGVLQGAVQATIDPALMLAVFAIIYFGVEVLGLALASLGVFLFVLLRLNEKAREFNLSRQTLSATVEALLVAQSVERRALSAKTIHSGERTFGGLQREIRFESVSFAYPGADEAVLTDVSLEIRKGQMVSFVGRSGAGKSTLVDLIPHLRDATAGRISIDGIPIEEFSLRSLRRRMGYMSQEAMLFDDTIRANLAYGLEREPSQEEIDSALAGAYCTEFVRQLPDGLETVVGSRGARLSGGQRQRLALGRVLLQDPDILILDEPTSALDSESEQYIQRALDALRGDKTLIIIAHRLSTVQRADRIFVMSRGEVVEYGDHKELIERAGAYKKLFELQLQG